MDRWKDMVPALAFQIFRFQSQQSSLVELEQNLREAFRFRSDMFQGVETHFARKLQVELARRVRDFKNLSAYNLFSIATTGRGHGPSRMYDGAERGLLDGSARDARDEAGVEDMATRLAHLGILHWRVWAQLAYAGSDSGDEMEGIDSTGCI